jgi:hypothetical protein
LTFSQSGVSLHIKTESSSTEAVIDTPPLPTVAAVRNKGDPEVKDEEDNNDDGGGERFVTAYGPVILTADVELGPGGRTAVKAALCGCPREEI